MAWRCDVSVLNFCLDLFGLVRAKRPVWDRLPAHKKGCHPHGPPRRTRISPTAKHSLMTTNADDTPIATGKEPEDASQAAKLDKAQARRAQVRKAQIQHRQRKANYVKQLEIDVASIRDMIAEVEQERRTLRAENNAMRAKLASTKPGVVEKPLPALPVTSPGVPASATESLFNDIDINEITMSMMMDSDVGTPVYQITSSPTSSTPSFHASPTSQLVSMEGTNEVPALSPEQTQQAINFILSYAAPSPRTCSTGATHTRLTLLHGQA
jgi:hypothetical protein